MSTSAATPAIAGHPLEQMIVWDPYQEFWRKNTPEAVRRRAYHPLERLLFPCTSALRRSRSSGSAAGIRAFASSPSRMPLRGRPSRRSNRLDRGHHKSHPGFFPPGTEWAVGTEIHLVNRLSKELRITKSSRSIPCVCVCTTDVPYHSSTSPLGARKSGRGQRSDASPSMSARATCQVASTAC